jgi:hypothetical protein
MLARVVSGMSGRAGKSWRGLGVLVGLSCGGAARAPLGPAPAPAGWWVVEAAQRPAERDDWPVVATFAVPSAAWRFVGAEVQAVRPGYIVDRVFVGLTGAGDGWTVSRAGSAPCELRREAEHLALRCAHGQTWVNLRPARGDEIASAEAALAQHGTPEAVCARAKACSDEALRAFPYLADYAPRGAPDLRLCEQSLLVLARQFRETRRPTPPSCMR